MQSDTGSTPEPTTRGDSDAHEDDAMVKQEQEQGHQDHRVPMQYTQQVLPEPPQWPEDLERYPVGAWIHVNNPSSYAVVVGYSAKIPGGLYVRHQPSQEMKAYFAADVSWPKYQKGDVVQVEQGSVTGMAKIVEILQDERRAQVKMGTAPLIIVDFQYLQPGTLQADNSTKRRTSVFSNFGWRTSTDSPSQPMAQWDMQERHEERRKRKLTAPRDNVPRQIQDLRATDEALASEARSRLSRRILHTLWNSLLYIVLGIWAAVVHSRYRDFPEHEVCQDLRVGPNTTRSCTSEVTCSNPSALESWWLGTAILLLSIPSVLVLSLALAFFKNNLVRFVRRLEEKRGKLPAGRAYAICISCILTSMWVAWWVHGNIIIWTLTGDCGVMEKQGRVFMIVTYVFFLITCCSVCFNILVEDSQQDDN